MTQTYFDQLAHEIENRLTTAMNNCYSEGIIDELLEFKVFYNTGKYLEEIDEDTINDKLVIFNISQGINIQDPDISIDTYISIVDIECLAFEKYRTEIQTIFNRFCIDNKSILVQVGANTVNILIEKYPEYSDILEYEGANRFTAEMSLNAVVFTNANLSNIFTIQINNIAVPYVQMDITRSTELVADLQKRSTTVFYPNTTGLQIDLNGLYVSNNILNTIFNDTLSNNRFNIPYDVSIYKYNSTTNENELLATDQYFIKDSTFSFKYSAIVSYALTLYKGITV